MRLAARTCSFEELSRSSRSTSPDSMSEDTCAKGVGGCILSGFDDRKATLVGGRASFQPLGTASSHWQRAEGGRGGRRACRHRR